MTCGLCDIFKALHIWDGLEKSNARKAMTMILLYVGEMDEELSSIKKAVWWVSISTLVQIATLDKLRLIDKQITLP